MMTDAGNLNPKLGQAGGAISMNDQEYEETRSNFYESIGSVISNHELILACERIILIDYFGAHVEPLINELDAKQLHHHARIHLPDRYASICEALGHKLERTIRNAEVASMLRNRLAHSAWKTAWSSETREIDTSKIEVVRSTTSRSSGGLSESKIASFIEFAEIAHFVSNCEWVLNYLATYTRDLRLSEMSAVEKSDWINLDKILADELGEWFEEKFEFALLNSDTEYGLGYYRLI
jgi:hypothetical protein